MSAIRTILWIGRGERFPAQVADAPLLDVVFGHHRELGRLPFELPTSMDAVRRQLPDLPDDSDEPLFPRGYGLSLAP